MSGERQVRWQRRMRASGRCVACGKTRSPYSRSYCQPCLEKRRGYARRREGHQPWKKGSAGRPPREKEEF